MCIFIHIALSVYILSISDAMCVSSDVLKRFIKNTVILFLSIKTSLIHRFLLSFQLGSVPQNV